MTAAIRNIKWKCAAKAAAFAIACAVACAVYFIVAALLQDHWLCAIWVFFPIFVFIGFGAYQHCTTR